MTEVKNATQKSLWPKYHSFTFCDWIQGKTYKRLKRENNNEPLKEVYPVGTELLFIGLVPSTRQILGKCDNCPRKHQPTNISCSMTLKTRSSFLDSSESLFVFSTQQPIKGTWKLVDIQTFENALLTKETYKRVA